MPHLVILYTPNLEPKTDMTALCRVLADTMLEQRDEAGQPVFPIGGTRVLAYPAAHYAVADGRRVQRPAAPPVLRLCAVRARWRATPAAASARRGAAGSARWRA